MGTVLQRICASKSVHEEHDVCWSSMVHVGK